MSNQSESPWWDDPDFDWTHDNPGALLNLLATSYPEQTIIASIMQAAELDFWSEPDTTPSAKALWKQVLKQAAMKRRFPALLAKVIDDQSGKERGPLFASLRDSLLSSPGQPYEGPIDGLQAITSAGMGLGDAVACVQAMMNLIWRTAAIKIEGHESGTGFLVGENLVLTAAHVVEPASRKPGKSRSIVAVFDFISGSGHSYAETGASAPVDGIIYHSPPTPGERASIMGEDWEASPENLDFALLQLTETAPSVRTQDGTLAPRGYYVLDPDSYRFDLSSILIVAQYPLKDFLKFSYIIQPPELNSEGTRIRYLCNTLNGSSGGPIVDTRGRLVALHHYSRSNENHGVPISPVARILKGRYAGLFDTAESGALAHFGTYSADAREKVCQGIADDWESIARELLISTHISNAYALWDWLASNRTLYKLRDALVKLGHTDLAHVLDYDVTKVDRSRISYINDQASWLARSIGQAMAARTPAELLALTSTPRHLAARLGTEMDRLPILQNHPLLALRWRMNWSGEFTRAQTALGKLARALPVSKAQASQALNGVTYMVEYAQEVESAVTALNGLARSPALSL
jgi:V8-like Glu-specific endopeptidase